MNKGEFVEALADRLDVSRAQADRALSAVLDIIAEQLGEGEKVAFTGFGSFEVSERAARTGRNPQTGATIEIAASSVPKFTAGATLKGAVIKLFEIPRPGSVPGKSGPVHAVPARFLFVLSARCTKNWRQREQNRLYYAPLCNAASGPYRFLARTRMPADRPQGL